MDVPDKKTMDDGGGGHMRSLERLSIGYLVMRGV